jgi:tRNA-uridine 2-sulfurtransferase
VRVLVAMSGGVDSSVAAARLADEGHEVVGATLKLWGGESDSGCCSLADVNDARRVADRLGIDHHVFNYEEVFGRDVIEPYVEAHRRGATPNPCVECNRHVKFGALLERADRLGFDRLATGHHARIRTTESGPELRRGADARKDQSYVLSVLGRSELARTVLPVGELTKDEVRDEARARGLRTADKPDSQEVCFISRRAGGRAAFLGGRIELHPGRLVDRSGDVLGVVDDLELLTLGQRRGIGHAGRARRYVVGLDVSSRTVVLGDDGDLLIKRLGLARRTWTGVALAPGEAVEIQTSAHGSPRRGRLVDGGVVFDRPMRAVASGQVVALYVGDVVVGSGIATP